MDFPQKLQELRKNKNMTQEQLASALYVSRTAVSKWESGRGYPSVDSLKALAAVFEITVDELLSGDELLSFAEQGDTCHRRARDVAFGLLDVGTGLLLFLPLFAQRGANTLSTVSLLSLNTVSPFLKFACITPVALAVLFGIAMLTLQNCRAAIWNKLKIGVSLLINTVAVAVFIVTLQPYAAVLLFVFLLIKIWMTRIVSHP